MGRSTAVLWLALAAGCSAAPGSGGARVGVRFAATSATTARRGLHTESTGSTPGFEYLRMRFLAVYLDVDLTAEQNPVGTAPIIYLNPECQGDNSPGACNLEGSGATHEVKQYLDFTDPAAVNATINGQAQVVAPGDYKYVSVDLCVGTPAEPNVQYKLVGGIDKTATSGTCGVHSLEASPPIHVGVGGQVTVTLAYDLSMWLTSGGGVTSVDGGGGGGYDASGLCDDTPTVVPRPPDESGAPGSRAWCVMPAAFVPSFAAN
jgi:hypothetical protein